MKKIAKSLYFNYILTKRMPTLTGVKYFQGTLITSE